jgi:hypothetical protein
MSGATSGRDVAIARRLALSAGKGALPPAKERVRVGFRSAGLPEAGSVAAAPAPVAAPRPAPVASAVPALVPAVSARLTGIERRRALSAGKAGLQAQKAGIPQAVAPAPVPATPVETCVGGSCRDQAKARRAAMAATGRGAAPPAQPSRTGKLDYAPKVVESKTQHGLHVTGSRIGRGQQVTGDERGTVMPVSGTQYIDAENGGAWRASGSKVGQARTENGLVVSGTLVRSSVRITGDERGDNVTITGKVDPRPSQDLTARPEGGAAVSAQFQRQSNPHGATVFGTNLGRSAQGVGSRQRQREPAIESTEAGAVISGSAIGRSQRVTGDEGGSCRPITGNQYLAPARRETACGGTGGGTAPAAHIGASRPDPVTGSKVGVFETWGGQRLTGLDLEHHGKVTGDAPGTCAALTGSQYQGPSTVAGFCGPDAAKSATARRMQARASRAVTGDTPLHDTSVSGLNRGAVRDISGTPYYREETPAAISADPVAAVDQGFSIRSPQRSAQLRSDRAANDGAGRITGSFAVGGGKVTGSFEFIGTPRVAANKDRAPAHSKISGEGSTKGLAITGNSYGENRNVTGTEGAFAADRNPTIRGEKGKAFAGATKFKNQANHEEPKQLVTGMVGYVSKSGARVTLSGGAQS